MNNVTVKWQNGQFNYLNIDFNGHFSSFLAKQSINDWKMAFKGLSSGNKATIVCNCLNMRNYDAEARQVWQKALIELKDKIDTIWIITDNQVFRLAAVTMNLLTKFPIRTARKLEDIYVS